MSSDNTGPSIHEKTGVHTSVLLRKIIADAAGRDYFTLDWLMSQMPENALAFIVLVFSLLSLVPVIDIPARLLLLPLTFKAITGNINPVIPRRLLSQNLPIKYLASLNRHAVPALVYFEKVVRPRWTAFLNMARPLTALAAFLLTLESLIIPIPFSNVPPAVATALFALAYIEKDGLLLFIALFFSVAILTISALPLILHFF